LPGTTARNNEVIFAEALKLSPKQKATIAYIGTASGDDISFFNMLKKNVSLLPGRTA